MKLDRITRAPRFKYHPILWRKIHKWVGLILGLQFVLWTLSGSVMALLDSDKVGGHSAAPVNMTAQPWPADMVPPAVGAGVQGLTLRRIIDRPVYEVKDQQGVQLLDARSGQRILIDAGLAQNIARDAFQHKSAISSVEHLAKANLEARDHAGAMWRVNFTDEENSSSYISAETGRALVNRGDTWRLWDIAWMLHNMDYVNRTSFNHPLIIFVAFGALWLSFTGFYLLFKSFRRREFRWILRSKRA